jgi:hypothetical protein
MRFKAGDWMLGAACVRCRRPAAIFRDAGDGTASMAPPVIGAFAFQCSHCRADNLTDTRALKRDRVATDALDHAA